MLFFIVPDVWLTWLALRSPAAALYASLWAAGGALLGGLAMYAWGNIDGAAALAWLDAVPGISPALCAQVADQMQAHGLLAMVAGAFSGVPYKIYAVQAGIADAGSGMFLAVSLPARLLRFAVTVWLFALILHGVRAWTPGRRLMLHVLLWSAFYAWYFATVE